ncbi:MAG: YciI family protein [Candidatus Limnocylindrales bacterium]
MTDPDAAPSPIELIWLIEATYAPDAAETRVPFRAEHIAGLQQLKRDGIVVEAGAFLDVSATIILVRAADEQAALAICRADVYLRNGVWVELRARAFGRVREG